MADSYSILMLPHVNACAITCVRCIHFIDQSSYRVPTGHWLLICFKNT